MALGAILQIAGTAFGIYSSFKSIKATQSTADLNAAELRRAAAENAAISRLDAEAMEKSARATQFAAGIEMMRHAQRVDAFIGAQKAAYAKSGVTLGTGSALDVVADTSRKAAIDSSLIEYEGKKAKAYRRDLAARYRRLADAGLRDAAAQVSIIESTADSVIKSKTYSAISSAGSNIYDIGQTKGWWS